MHAISMSYELSQKYRLVARTAPEVYYGLNELITRFAARDSVQFRGRKLGVEAALNAIALNWLALPEAEQLRVIREGVERFEQLLEGGDTSPVPAPELDPTEQKKANPEGSAKVVPPDGIKVNLKLTPGDAGAKPRRRRG